MTAAHFRARTNAPLAIGLAALGAFAGAFASPLGAQTGGGEPREAQVRFEQRRLEPALARELAAHEAERLQLLRRIEALADQLDEDPALAPADRRRLQGELEAQVRRLTAVHTRLGAEVGTRIVLERQPSVASVEVRRTTAEAQRRLAAATRIGYVGITLSEAQNMMRSQDGALFVRYFTPPAIISVEPNSPAERAGLQRGDTVLAYNGLDVRRELPMHLLLKPGNRLQLRVRRAGAERTVPIAVAEPPQLVLRRREDFLLPTQNGELMPGGAPVRTPPGARGMGAMPSRVMVRTPMGQPGGSADVPEGPTFFRFELARGVAGAMMKPVGDGLAKALGVSHGVLVLEVAPRSPAATSGLRDGDVVVKADGRAVHDIPDLSRAMREQDEAREVALEVMRERKARKVLLKW